MPEALYGPAEGAAGASGESIPHLAHVRRWLLLARSGLAAGEMMAEPARGMPSGEPAVNDCPDTAAVVLGERVSVIDHVLEIGGACAGFCAAALGDSRFSQSDRRFVQFLSPLPSGGGTSAGKVGVRDEAHQPTTFRRLLRSRSGGLGAWGCVWARGLTHAPHQSHGGRWQRIG